MDAPLAFTLVGLLFSAVSFLVGYFVGEAETRQHYERYFHLVPRSRDD